MENSNTEKILAKLRKLMMKEQSAKELGNMEEAFAFAQGIQKILNEYNLSMSDIDMSDKSSPKPGMTKGFDVKSKGFKGRGGVSIMHVIAKYNWCKVFWQSETGSINPKVTIVGLPQNVEVVKYLFSVVMRSAESIGKKEYRNYVKSFEKNILNDVLGNKKPSRGKYMRAFIQGFKNGLEDKFLEERNKFQQSNDKAGAIILVNDKMIDTFVRESLGDTTTFSQKFSKVGNAMEKGYESGKNLEISKGISGTSKPIDVNLLG